MKSRILGALIAMGAIAPSIAVGANAPSIGSIVGVVYDPPCTQPSFTSSYCWQGWMNASPPLDDWFGYGYWDTAALPATFLENTLTLAPNTNVTSDWFLAPGSSNMDANIFVVDDTLAGQTVTFSGRVMSNTLVSPYVSIAFIRDFDPDWGNFVQATAPLVDGQVFQVSLTTAPGHHVEYGFETNGPNADPEGASLLGSVQVGPVPATLLQQLLRHVTGVGPGTSLADKVTLAWVYYFSGNKQEVCGDMTGFVNEVAAQRGKRLTQAQADQFTSEAGVFMASIGCK